MNKPQAFPVEAIKPIQDLPLFYPCSGNDLREPIKTFAPHVKEFWFVDIGYFPNGEYESVAPVLNSRDGYELLDVVFRLANIPESEWKNDAKYQACPPIVRTETYLHTATGETIRVHRHRRKGPSALRTEVDELGIFFYRGDSDDGGSGTHWLTLRKWADPAERERTFRKGALVFTLLDKLADGGLLVTDGSMCYGANNPYRELRRFRSTSGVGARAVNEVQPFTDPMGRTFRCIGYAGEHHGVPTLIWQVSKG